MTARLPAAASLWLVLSAGVAAWRGESAERYLIALEHRGPSVAFAEHPRRCGPDRASRDIVWGTVEGHEAESEADAVVYEGVLQRMTEQSLCGARVHVRPGGRVGVSTPLCRAALSGVGDVKARIKIYRRGASLQGAWIVLTPIDGMARVTGNCRSGEMREMQKAYGERTTIEIQTPPDGLMPGRYPAAMAPSSTARWILHVAPVSGAPSS